jgi:hypothetical protein
MPTLRTILGITPSILLVVLLWILIRVRVYREFEWFVVYVGFAVCADVARFALRNEASVYFYIYWGTDAGYAILGILVLYQVFRSVFRDLMRIWYVRLLFPAMLVLAVTLALLRYELFPSRISGDLLIAIVVSELAVRLLQVTLFCLLVCLVYLFGLHWRQYAFGIAAGFGLYATTALVATTKFYESGTEFTFVWGTALLVSYIVAVVIWIYFFSLARVQHPPAQTPPMLSADNVRRYKEVARRILWR